MKYYPPEFKRNDFHCPTCGVYARQAWYQGYHKVFDSDFFNAMHIAVCAHCEKASYWLEGRMVSPEAEAGEMPAPDMPEDCLRDFNEARDIAGKSPRGAIALLRLSLRKLMPHLGQKGEDIDADIAALVEDGLSPLIKKALSHCRVIGRNAAGPGEIDLKDTPEIAHSLFRLINIIVQDRITAPREIQVVLEALSGETGKEAGKK